MINPLIWLSPNQHPVLFPMNQNLREGSLNCFWATWNWVSIWLDLKTLMILVCSDKRDSAIPWHAVESLYLSYNLQTPVIKYLEKVSLWVTTCFLSPNILVKIMKLIGCFKICWRIWGEQCRICIKEPQSFYDCPIRNVTSYSYKANISEYTP